MTTATTDSGEERIDTTRDHRGATGYAALGCFSGLEPGRATLLLTAHSRPALLAAAEQMTRSDHIRAMASRFKLVHGQSSYCGMLIRVLVD